MSAAFPVISLATLPMALAGSPFGPFRVMDCDGLAGVVAALHAAPPSQGQAPLVVLELDRCGGLTGLSAWPALGQVVQAAAVVVVVEQAEAVLCEVLLSLGVREVLDRSDLAHSLGRRLRMALEHKRSDDAARRALSLDLNTGLPHQQQLLEHMTHLLALREREPAAMAVIVLHLEGFRAAKAHLGDETTALLRRKAAVRLRSALRASDVVASLGHDQFAVLLAWIDTEADGERVARKLLKSISQPFHVAGQSVPVGARIGVSQYPQDGKEAATLLQQASHRAAGEGLTRLLGAGAAANDEP
jgi:diguanylate cyclase (GGDEF)-like protein